MKILLIITIYITLCTCNKINFKEFTTGNREFTSELYKNIAKNNDNFIVSPLSVEIVLAVAQSGARNETGEEIRQALHLPNSVDKVETIFNHLLPKLKSRKQSYSLFNANKIFIKNNFLIKKDFVELAKKIYNCPIENVDFSKKGHVVKIINNWVEKKTNNKIHGLVDIESLSDDTVAILINAIYFKGQWFKTFNRYSTKKQSFFTFDNEEIEVEMMHNKQNYEYYESENMDAKFLKLSFKNSNKAQMVLVLPNKKDGLKDLNVDKVLKTPIFEKYQVEVALPKFKIETKINFYEILKSMGVNQAFSGNADFSLIAGEKGQLQIGEILQKTFIDVHEAGVEAVAASSVHFWGRSFLPQKGETKSFIADHPFLFYLKIKNVIVFVGQVLHPSS